MSKEGSGWEDYESLDEQTNGSSFKLERNETSLDRRVAIVRGLAIAVGLSLPLGTGVYLISRESPEPDEAASRAIDNKKSTSPALPSVSASPEAPASNSPSPSPSPSPSRLPSQSAPPSPELPPMEIQLDTTLAPKPSMAPQTPESRKPSNKEEGKEKTGPNLSQLSSTPDEPKPNDEIQETKPPVIPESTENPSEQKSPDSPTPATTPPKNHKPSVEKPAGPDGPDPDPDVEPKPEPSKTPTAKPTKPENEPDHEKPAADKDELLEGIKNLIARAEALKQINGLVRNNGNIQAMHLSNSEHAKNGNGSGTGQRIADLLKTDPDFITVSSEELNTYAESLPSNYESFPSVTKGQNIDNMIIWNSERWNLSDDITDNSGSEVLKESTEAGSDEKNLTWVNLKSKTGETVTVATTDFIGNSENNAADPDMEQAEAAARAWVERMKTRGPAILNGDTAISSSDDQLGLTAGGFEIVRSNSNSKNEKTGEYSAYAAGGAIKHFRQGKVAGGNTEVDAHIIEFSPADETEPGTLPPADPSPDPSPASGESQPSTPIRTRVASINIRGADHEGKPVDAIPLNKRLDNMYEFLNKNNIGFGGMQEVAIEQSRMWKKRHGDKYGIYTGDGHNRRAIYYDKSQFDIDEKKSGIVKMPYINGRMVETPYAWLVHKETKQPVMVVSVHNRASIGRNENPSREKATRLQTDFFEKHHNESPDVPAFLMADVNERGKDYYCDFTENGLMANAAGGSNDKGKICEAPKDMTIDVIFGSDEHVKFDNYKVSNGRLVNRMTDHKIPSADATIQVR